MNPTRLFSLVALFLLTATLAFGQVSGRVSGTVTDPSGNVIIGADVTLVNTGTGEERNMPSNETGSFVFTALQPSSYTLRVQSEGFQVFEQINIIVTAEPSCRALVTSSWYSGQSPKPSQWKPRVRGSKPTRQASIKC